MSTAKQLSIYLMLVHQVIAFCLYSAPLYYMSEKLFGVHTNSMPLKLLARLPVCEFDQFGCLVSAGMSDAVIPWPPGLLSVFKKCASQGSRLQLKASNYTLLG